MTMATLERSPNSRGFLPTPLARIGLIIPSSNRLTEPQLRHFAPPELGIHVTRLQDILREEHGEADAIKCKALAALVTEAQDLIKDATDPTVRDVALIAAAQRVEHYEIASYGTVRRWAEILGEAEQAALLDKTVQEEGHADQLLTSIADRVNVEADKAA